MKPAKRISKIKESLWRPTAPSSSLRTIPTTKPSTLRAFTKNKIANQVVVARDGVEALDYLFCTGQYIDPGQPHDACVRASGSQAAAHRWTGGAAAHPCRRKDRAVPVVVLTTSKEHQDIFEAYRLGANSYIRKPVDFERFLQAVGATGALLAVPQ